MSSAESPRGRSRFLGAIASAQASRTVVAAMVLGVAVRLVWLPLGSGTARFTNVDSLSYRAVASKLPTALWSPDAGILDYSLQRTPVYPAFLWLTTGGGSWGIGVAVVVQCLVGGLLNVWLCALLARRLFGVATAGPAALLLALDPVSIGHSLQIGTETVFATLLLLVILALERATRDRRPQLGWMAVSGALLGIAALTRPVMLYAPIVAGLVVVVAGRRARVASAALLLVGAGVPIGAWYVRNEVATGTWLFSTAEGQNLFDYGAAAVSFEEGRSVTVPGSAEDARIALTEAGERLRSANPTTADLGDVVVRDAYWTRVGVGALVDHPRGYLGVASQGLVRGLGGPGHTQLEQVGPGRTTGVHGLLFALCALALGMQYLLAAYGALLTSRRRLWRSAVLLAAPGMYYLVMSAGPQMYARFRVPVVPFLCVIAAAGLVGVRRGATHARLPSRDVPAAAEPRDEADDEREAGFAERHEGGPATS